MTGGLSILMSSALWIQWGSIAIDRERRARAARSQLVALHRHGQPYGDTLVVELDASIVAVSAAAHALDALYGQLITDAIRAAGPKGKGREAHIRECLKRRFKTGRRDVAWVQEFDWLFKLRDAAVHAEVKLLPPVAHPSGIGNSGQVSADYSAEAAMRAVDLLIDVLETCIANPKPGDKDAKAWANDYRSSVETLAMQRDVSRDARPIVTA